ncbi:MAG: hypothetical protein AAFX94_16675 [Myxococcota bacterium]
MQITVPALQALGTVDYDQDGSISTADYDAARADVRALDLDFNSASPVVDRRDAMALAFALAPAPGNDSLREATEQACVRLRRGADALRIAGDWRAATHIEDTCSLFDTVRENTPLGPHPEGSDGTQWIQVDDLQRALAVGEVGSPFDWGEFARFLPGIGALETAVRSAPGESAVATSPRAWGELVPDTRPSGLIEGLAYDFLVELRNAGATLYVSRQSERIFPDRRAFLQALEDTAGENVEVELSGRLYLTWPEGGPERLRVSLGQGMEINVSRNASFRLMRLSNGTLIVDSVRGVQGNWKTGWANLNAALLADQQPAPFAAVRASVLGAPVEQSGVLEPWGNLGDISSGAPDPAQRDLYQIRESQTRGLLRLP